MKDKKLWIVAVEDKFNESNLEYEAFIDKEEAEEEYRKLIKENEKEGNSVRVLLCQVVRDKEIN